VKLRALLFDDDASIRELLQVVLERRGYEVLTYTEPGLCPLNDAAECPCPSGTLCADVIISDLNMPHRTGLDFVQDLLQKKCRRPFIALMSGDWTDNQIDHAADLACKVFHKPFKVAEIVNWLQGVETVILPQRRLFDWHSPAHNPK
jgi:DNA-binding response OmpR family regulator